MCYYYLKVCVLIVVESTDIADDELRFGDEIECGIYLIDPITKTVKLSVRSAEVEQLQLPC